MSGHHEDLGGDRTETVECPLCGEEMANTRVADHMRSEYCDGEVQTDVEKTADASGGWLEEYRHQNVRPDGGHTDD